MLQAVADAVARRASRIYIYGRQAAGGPANGSGENGICMYSSRSSLMLHKEPIVPRAARDRWGDRTGVARESAGNNGCGLSFGWSFRRGARAGGVMMKLFPLVSRSRGEIRATDYYFGRFYFHCFDAGVSHCVRRGRGGACLLGIYWPVRDGERQNGGEGSVNNFAWRQRCDDGKINVWRLSAC